MRNSHKKDAQTAFGDISFRFFFYKIYMVTLPLSTMYAIHLTVITPAVCSQIILYVIHSVSFLFGLPAKLRKYFFQFYFYDVLAGFVALTVQA